MFLTGTETQTAVPCQRLTWSTRLHGIRLPTPDEMPLAARPDVEEFRATATGDYVLKLFAKEKPQGLSA